MTDPDLDKTDGLIFRAERTIDKIESEQYHRGIKKPDLLSGSHANDDLEVERSSFSSARKAGQFEIEEGIDFASFTKYKSLSEISWDQLQDKSLVEAGQLIAKWVNESEEQKLLFCSEDYTNISNMQVSQEAQCLRFRSRIKGVVVLLSRGLFIYPANQDGVAKIEISADKMQAKCIIQAPRGNGEPVCSEDLQSLLDKENVIFGYTPESLDKIISDLEKFPQRFGQEIICARGIIPQDGKDGFLIKKYEKKVSDEYTIDENGRIDYRKTAHIPMAAKGDLLVELIEPSAGINGKDVFGKELPALSGKPVVLWCGQNVKCEDKNKFFAINEGLIVLVHNMLSVMPHYLVPGDVDMGTGNIQFNGCVTVRGNVLPGFSISATGDVIIQGNVEGGVISAGRDVRIGGGLIGGELGGNKISVRCGQHLFASYLQNAHVEVQGDVIVKGSVMHSVILCTGQVLLDNSQSRLVGGKTCALRRVSAATIGSSMGTKTEVEAGHDYLVAKLSKEVDKGIEFCEESIKKIAMFLKPLGMKLQSESNLSSEQKARIHLVMAKKNELSQLKEQYEAKKNYLQKISQSNEEADIIISKVIYPDVLIHISKGTMLINSSQDKCRYIYNSKTTKVEKSVFKIPPLADK